MEPVLEAKSRKIRLLCYPAGIQVRSIAELNLLRDSLEEWAIDHAVVLWLPGVRSKTKTVSFWVDGTQKKILSEIPSTRKLIASSLGNFAWQPELLCAPSGSGAAAGGRRLPSSQEIAWISTTTPEDASHPRATHWELLARATAVQQASYLVAAQFWGSKKIGFSRLIDPRGKILSERPKGNGLVWADLSNDLLNDAKAELEEKK